MESLQSIPLDPIYRILGVDEADLHPFYRAQIQKAAQVPWSFGWSLFSHEKDNLPKMRHGGLDEFLRSVGKSIQLQEKSGPAVSGSIFATGTTRSKENVVASSVFGFDYDDAKPEDVQAWMWHKILPGCAVIVHSSFRDGTPKPEDPATINTKFRVFVPLQREVTVDEFEVLTSWLFAQATPDFGERAFDTSCKDPSRLFFTMRTNPKSVRKPWIVVREGVLLDPDRLADGVSVQGLLEQERDRVLAEERAREKERQSLQKRISSYSEASNESEFVEHYSRLALQAVCREVASTPESGGKYNGRNNALFHHASCMGELVGAGAISESEVTEDLVRAGQLCGMSEREARNAAQNGIRFGASKPRDLTALRLDYREKQHQKRERARNIVPPTGGPVQDAGQVSWGGDMPPSIPPRTPPENGGSDDSGGEGSDDRESIHFGFDDDMHEKCSTILNWLYVREDNRSTAPEIFMRGREIVRLVHSGSADIWTDKPLLEIEPMDNKALRNHLINRVQFTKSVWRTNQDTGQSYESEQVTDLPLNLCDNILAYPHHRFPQLEEIIRNPVIDADGCVVSCDGYRPKLKAWVSLGGVKVEVPERPNLLEMQEAKRLILDDLFGDFLFADPASRTNALALCLLPYVRHLIRGCTPMHMISAPIRGTGKSLLTALVSLVATGEWPENMTEGRDDEEWRKRITAALISTPSFIVIDNINRKLDTGSLASVLTSTIWVDRLMGHSKVARVRNTSIWCATANNPKLSDEIERRCVYIHMDPGTDSPETRSGFKHHPIQQWALKNRDKLLSACLTLIRYWAVNGKELAFDKSLASFEQWSSLIGGILKSIGEIDHFLANRNMYRDRSDSEGVEWRTFLKLWFEVFGKEPVFVRDLAELASNNEILEAVLGTKNERSQRIRMGKALGAHQGRVFGTYRIKKVEEGTKVNQWRLEDLSPE